MTGIFNSLVAYLHDVFIIKFDAWVILGFVAQAFFTMRFVVQWIASERARKSVIPVAFWFFSIGGGSLLDTSVSVQTSIIMAIVFAVGGAWFGINRLKSFTIAGETS